MKFNIKLNRRRFMKLINWLTVVSLFTFAIPILYHSDTWAADQCSSIYTTSKVKAKSKTNPSRQIFDPQISKAFWDHFKEERFQSKEIIKFLEDFQRALFVKMSSESSGILMEPTTVDRQSFDVQLNLFKQYLHYKFRYSVTDHVGLRAYQSMAFANAFESSIKRLDNHSDRSALLVQYMREFGFNDKEIAFAKSLTVQDYVDGYLRKKIDLETLLSKLMLQAENAGLPLPDFTANQLLYFTSQAYSNSTLQHLFYNKSDGSLVPRGFGFERIWEAIKLSTNSGPQDYFYHVTPIANVPSIAKKGLIANYLPNWLDISEPREHSKNGVFFSASLTRAGDWLSLYKARVDEKNRGEDLSNSLLNPTLIRVKARYDSVKSDYLAKGGDDIIFNGDLRPKNLEFWNGSFWIDMSKQLGELKPITIFPQYPIPLISTSVSSDGVWIKSVVFP